MTGAPLQTQWEQITLRLTLFYSKSSASIICYDHNKTGRKANLVVFENARDFFPKSTTVKIFKFPQAFFKGYDLSNYLDN